MHCCKNCGNNNCCCRPVQRPAAAFGQGMFNGAQGGFEFTVAPGDLVLAPGANFPSAEITIPLDTFGPMNCVGCARDSLVIQQDGFYEISYYAGVEFGTGVQAALYVARAGAQIDATWSQWSTGGITPTQTVAKTALVRLCAGARLSLVARVWTAGETLIVSPRALLSVRRIL